MSFRNGYKLPQREKPQSLEDFSRRWSSRWLEQPVETQSLKKWLETVIAELDEYTGGEEFHSIGVFESGGCYYFRINLHDDKPEDQLTFYGSLSVSQRMDGIFGLKTEQSDGRIIGKIGDFCIENGDDLYFSYPKAVMFYLPELAVSFASRVIATVLCSINEFRPSGENSELKTRK